MTDGEIANLISFRKTITEAPRREFRLVNADLRNDMKLAAEGISGEFYAFMRINEDFRENFSVGLKYHPRDGNGDFVLIRCNGPHGGFNGKIGYADHPHWAFHIHKATARAIEAGEKAEKFAEITGEYASYEEALWFFLREINLDPADIAKYFSSNMQPRLFVN